MVDGFMQLSQEEQIALLKGCVFELAAIVVTRHYNPETTSLILGREIFPASIFRPSEQAELNFFLGVSLKSFGHFDENFKFVIFLLF